ncbi:MAG: hypothetical protein HZB23_05020 [Deltaproteobacteria bacterium]|nr:hypothetical protein [Deltaproteobacteria bacterium]
MSTNERWEDLFARSTEDISNFLWAAESLLKPPPGYEPDHLLVVALLSRFRARTALALLPDAPADEYQALMLKLLKLKDKAEAALARFARATAMDVRGIEARIDLLGESLKRIKDMTEDSILFGAPPEAENESKDMIHAFLLRFNALSIAVGELSAPPFSELDLGNLPERLNELENDFRMNSHCLGAVSDLLPRMAEREYNRAPWWLTPPKNPAPFPEDVASSPFAPYADELRQEGAEAARDCPQAGRVIALALGEAAPGEEASTREHVVVCHGCRRLFLDVMALSGAAPSEPAPDIWAEAWPEARKKPRLPLLPAIPMRPVRGLSSARWPFAALFLLVSAITIISAIFGRSLLPVGRPTAPAVKPETAQVPYAASQAAGRVFEPGPRELAIKVMGKRRKGVAMGGLIAGYTEFAASPGQVMKSRDGFRISFVTNKASHAYVFFWGSAGDIRPLMRGSFDANHAVTIPGGDGWYYLDDHAGLETIWIFLSEKEIPDFDQRLLSLEKADPNSISTLFPEAQPFSFSIRHEA